MRGQHLIQSEIEHIEALQLLQNSRRLRCSSWLSHYREFLCFPRELFHMFSSAGYLSDPGTGSMEGNELRVGLWDFNFVQLFRCERDLLLEVLQVTALLQLRLGVVSIGQDIIVLILLNSMGNAIS
jgi:hypothetical protein